MAYVWGPAVTVGTDPTQIAFGDGSLWVGNITSGTLSRVDTATLSVTATITGLSQARAVIFAFGSVWVSHSSNSVSRIDPATNTITATITGLGLAYNLAADSNYLWVPDYSAGFVRRVDPTSNTVTGTITISFPTAVATGYGSLWVASFFSTLYRIDPSSLAVTATITLGLTPWSLLDAFGSIWVGHLGQIVPPNHQLSRVDPATNGVIATVNLGSGTVYSLVSDGSAVWATNQNSRIDRVDPSTNLSTANLIVPNGQTISYAGVDGNNRVWVSDTGSVINRIDPGPVGWVRGHAWG